MQGIRIVAHHIEAAAFRGTFRPERADNDMASALHGPGDIANIGDALFHCRQKMKHGAVVPHVVHGGLQFGDCDIGYQPTDPARGSAYALLLHSDLLVTFLHGDLAAKNTDLVSIRVEFVKSKR